MKNNSIKKLLTVLAISLGISGLVNAQTITGYRYWFDNNIGTASAVSVTAASNIDLTAALSANTLAFGYHSITTQFKDANGIYSSPITKTFVRTDFNLVAYDYWWDANYSNHTLVNITASQTVDLTAAVHPFGLDTGMHLFAIRFKDQQGNWSVPLQDTVHITFISGIHELSTVNDISLSPNPTHANANLRFDGSGDEILTMTITDAFGKTVQVEQLQNGFALQNYELNTGELAAGIYFVTLSSGNGSVTRKLVVQ